MKCKAADYPVFSSCRKFLCCEMCFRTYWIPQQNNWFLVLPLWDAHIHTYIHVYMYMYMCVCAMCSGVGSYFNQRTEYLKLTSTNNDRDVTLQREGVKTPKQGLPGKGKGKQTPNLNTSWVGSLLSFLIQCRSKISLGCKGKTGLLRDLGFIASCNR